MEIPTPIKYCTAHAQHVMHTRIHIAAIKIILCAEINNNDGCTMQKKTMGTRSFSYQLRILAQGFYP